MLLTRPPRQAAALQNSDAPRESLERILKTSRGLMHLVLAEEPPFHAHIFEDQPPASCDVQAMIVVAGSFTDRQLQEALPAYREWRERAPVHDAGPPAEWSARKQDTAAYPLFPRLVCVIAGPDDAAVAAAFKELFVHRRIDIAIFLPSAEDNMSAFAEDSFVATVARLVRDAHPVVPAAIKKHTGKFKQKLAHLLHISATRPPAYTGMSYTTLSRQNPRVYLCAQKDATPWALVMGYTEVPHRDRVAKVVLEIVDACRDALATWGT